MPDMLVPLYKLPPLEPVLDTMDAQNVLLRRAYPFELSRVRRFVARHFSEGWADEAEVAFARRPIGCYIAVEEKRIVGFACIESTARGFFGPTGVDEAQRGRGIGKALLLAALHGLREAGYAYGIIGGAGPTEFYARAAGATPIPDSSPGIYVDMLAPDGQEKKE